MRLNEQCYHHTLPKTTPLSFGVTPLKLQLQITLVNLVRSCDNLLQEKRKLRQEYYFHLLFHYIFFLWMRVKASQPSLTHLWPLAPLFFLCIYRNGISKMGPPVLSIIEWFFSNEVFGVGGNDEMLLSRRVFTTEGRVPVRNILHKYKDLCEEQKLCCETHTDWDVRHMPAAPQPPHHPPFFKQLLRWRQRLNFNQTIN